MMYNTNGYSQRLIREREKTMRSKKTIKGSVSLILALLISGNLLLSSCSNDTAGSTTSLSTTTESTTEETTTATESSEEAAADTEPSVKNDIPTTEIKLDGNRESKVTTTGFSYIETDDLIIFMDKDVTIPGDLVVNIEAIMKELESQLGISFNVPGYENRTATDMSIYYTPLDGSDIHPDPWDGWKTGSKVQIFIVVDRKPEGWISGAGEDGITLCEYDLFSDEVWNSIPDFRDNPWRRNGYIDYSTVAHELTHTLTERNCDLTRILTEGIAQYMGYSVVNSLADKYPSIAEVRKKKDFDDGNMPQKVNDKNAEEIFLDDYNTLNTADRGAEYYYGRRLFEYLYKTYGPDCFKDLCKKIVDNEIELPYKEYDKAVLERYDQIMKELYGEDVFSKFGKWCVKKGYLQD